MPADFFWKFDQWSKERAFSTLSRVMERVFAALMARHNAGLLKLESVNVERGHFEVSFDSCAECQGASASRPACFFHAGTFAGIMAAMLNRRMEAVELTCEAVGGGPCRFLIGDEADRRLSAQSEAALEGKALELRVSRGKDGAAGQDGVAGLVALSYYQLLLASAFLPNLAVLEDACMSAGRRIGKNLATLLDGGSDPAGQISRLYSELRYMSVDVREANGGITVTATGAPETLGPMRDAALVPFICGELESLLSALTGRKSAFAGVERQGENLLLRFAPEV
jgi:hypothetical protein